MDRQTDTHTCENITFPQQNQSLEMNLYATPKNMNNAKNGQILDYNNDKSTGMDPTISSASVLVEESCF